MRDLLISVAALLLTACGVAQAQEAPYTLKVQRNEVIVDLFAVNHSTYVPDSGLVAEDLDITDNAQRVKLTSFTHSGAGSLRPLALWIVSQCDLKGWQSSGSRFVQHRAATMADGLHHLRPEDTVAAAGWCDDGRQKVGNPSRSVDAVAAEIEEWTAQTKVPKGTSKRTGELALQTMLHDISAEVPANNPRPLPVLVFLHQDDTGTDAVEYSRVLSILLEQSSIAFVASDGKGTYQPSPGYLAAGNVGHVLQQLAADTGGSVIVAGSFADHPNVLGEVLASIIDRLHGRYEISFVPQKLDGTVHSLDVRLNDIGRRDHGSTSLKTRKSYLAPTTR